MMPRLVINQTFGSLAIESKRAQLSPPVKQFRMTASTQSAKFTTSTPLPQVQIDQTEAFASSGLKPVLRVSSDFYRDSLSKGIETIGRIASEGTAFLRIENGSNPVPQIARQKMQKNVDLTVKSMPSVPPEIQFTGSDFKLEWSPGTLDIQWDSVDVQPFEYTPGEVIISWGQRPSIEITVEPGSELMLPVNSGVGMLVDEAT